MARTKKMDAPIIDNLQRHWGWLLSLGIIFLFMGCLGMGMVVGLTLMSMYFFSFLLIIAGISHFADAFKYRQWKGAVWQSVIALMYLIGAMIVFYDPFLASVVITALLAWVLIIIGAARIGMAFSLKHSKGWGWLLFAGLMAIILGILILLQWPISGLWVIGMFIAIDLIIYGWTYIFMAFALRSTV